MIFLSVVWFFIVMVAILAALWFGIGFLIGVIGIGWTVVVVVAALITCFYVQLLSE